jgi:aspartyl-tRNA(Asn)/glutamyl-tRNA(Gln) amidotransferase subunit C
MGRMITIQDTQKLADLARIEITEAEAEKLTKEIDSILGFVGQIQNATGDMTTVVPEHRNIMRDDVATNEKGEFTESILENAPTRTGQFVSVKKIL